MARVGAVYSGHRDHVETVEAGSRVCGRPENGTWNLVTGIDTALMAGGALQAGGYPPSQGRESAWGEVIESAWWDDVLACPGFPHSLTLPVSRGKVRWVKLDLRCGRNSSLAESSSPAGCSATRLSRTPALLLRRSRG